MALKAVLIKTDKGNHGVPKVTITSGSPNVKKGGIQLVHTGCSASCSDHGSVTLISSSKNRINGHAIMRDGDTASCGAVFHATQSEVFSE